MIQISSTGLPHADRARLENSVRALGGAYAGDLTDRTTHLVATKIHPRSAKLACALKLGLPIVLPQWVHASGTAGEPLPLGPHHVPPALSGVVLAVGGHHRLAEADARAAAVDPGRCRPTCWCSRGATAATAAAAVTAGTANIPSAQKGRKAPRLLLPSISCWGHIGTSPRVRPKPSVHSVD